MGSWNHTYTKGQPHNILQLYFKPTQIPPKNNIGLGQALHRLFYLEVPYKNIPISKRSSTSLFAYVNKNLYSQKLRKFTNKYFFLKGVMS
jgi:hypothetical protein